MRARADQVAPIVAVDVTACVVGSTGVGRYAQGIWAELVRRDDVVLKGFAVGRGLRLSPLVQRVPVPLRVVHMGWSTMGWPTAERIVGRFDLLHTLDMVPAPTVAPVALMIHDVFAVRNPELCSPRARSIQLRQLKAARECAVILTISETTADTIAEVTDVPRDRVVATGMGPLEVLQATPATGEYLLAVGAITPRKGFEYLAAAVNRLPDCPPLRIVGPDGWGADQTRERVREADRKGKVSFVGSVSDEELAGLYGGARAFCQSSLTEGFGMACLDAMALGCPMVVTDLPSTREMVESAAILVPPGDEEAMLAGITAVLNDPVAAASRALAGRERATAHTWKRAGDRVVSAYNQALGISWRGGQPAASA
jgi:glycosyltransferase involved in cell wall biosynthesis